MIGGDKSKSNFDDFDNVQELDRNKEFAMLLAPLFLGEEAYQKVVTDELLLHVVPWPVLASTIQQPIWSSTFALSFLCVAVCPVVTRAKPG